jgi:hypothetical protein
VSQAGITRADMVDYLELHGWTKQPRRRGEPVYWSDPTEQATWKTVNAYEIAKCREGGGR